MALNPGGASRRTLFGQSFEVGALNEAHSLVQNIVCAFVSGETWRLRSDQGRMQGVVIGGRSMHANVIRLDNWPWLAGVMHAIRRTAMDKGTSKSKMAREAGLVPGIVYGVAEDGSNEYIPLWVREKDLMREMRNRSASFENTLFDLVIDGKRTRVLPRHVNMHVCASCTTMI